MDWNGDVGLHRRLIDSKWIPRWVDSIAFKRAVQEAVQLARTTVASDGCSRRRTRVSRQNVDFTPENETRKHRQAHAGSTDQKDGTMKLFVTAFAAVWVGVFAWNAQSSFIAGDAYRYLLQFALSLVFAPLIANVSTALAINCLTPRQLFHRPNPAWAASCFLGLAAGLLSLIGAMLGVAFLDRFASDSVLTAGCSVTGTLAMVICLQRVRPWQCLNCDYDLRASIQSLRCPECGFGTPARNTLTPPANAA